MLRILGIAECLVGFCLVVWFISGENIDCPYDSYIIIIIVVIIIIIIKLTKTGFRQPPPYKTPTTKSSPLKA